MGAELIQAGRQPDGQTDMPKLKDFFLGHANAPNNRYITKLGENIVSQSYTVDGQIGPT